MALFKETRDDIWIHPFAPESDDRHLSRKQSMNLVKDSKKKNKTILLCFTIEGVNCEDTALLMIQHLSETTEIKSDGADCIITYTDLYHFLRKCSSLNFEIEY